MSSTSTSSALVSKQTLLLVFAGTAAVLAAFVWRFNFVSDDAFILFRYSKNFAQGLGLVYNPGMEPPVEGYSEFLWAVLLGGVERLGWDIAFWSRFLTILGSFVLLGCVLNFGHKRLALSGLGLAASGLFFATLPTVGVWTTGGLSSSLFALCIFLCFEALFSDPGNPNGVKAGLAGVATCLLRADGPFWIVVIIGVWLVSFLWRRCPATLDDHGRAAVPARVFWSAFGKSSAILVIAGGIFIAWRMHTYGDYLPNTARAKVGMSAISLERGLKYVLHYWAILPATVVALLFGLGLLILRLARKQAAAFDALCAAALIAAATFCYSILVGGDFMAMGRFFFPAAAFLALLFGSFLERLQRVSSMAGLGVGALLIATNVAPAADTYLAPKSMREALWFRWSSPTYESEYVFWRGMRDRCSEWSLIGKALALHTSPDESLVLGPIGAVGYYSDLVILDLYGLTNSEVLKASKPASVRSTPGHDRLVDIEFFDRFQPTYRSAYLSRPQTSAANLKRLAKKPDYDIFELNESDGFPPNRSLVLRRW